MAYWDQSLLSTDSDFRARIASCAAVEVDESNTMVGGPLQWAADHQWEISAAPGFADKYASAIVAGVERPGKEQSVISDGDILSAVQHVANPPAE